MSQTRAQVQQLIGHSSFRAVMEILNTVFDYRGLSLGTIHNIIGLESVTPKQPELSRALVSRPK